MENRIKYMDKGGQFQQAERRLDDSPKCAHVNSLALTLESVWQQCLVATSVGEFDNSPVAKMFTVGGEKAWRATADDSWTVTVHVSVEPPAKTG